MQSGIATMSNQIKMIEHRNYWLYKYIYCYITGGNHMADTCPQLAGVALR